MQYIRNEIAAPNGVPRVSLPPGKLKWKPLPKLSHDEKELFVSLHFFEVTAGTADIADKIYYI